MGIEDLTGRGDHHHGPCAVGERQRKNRIGADATVRAAVDPILHRFEGTQPRTAKNVQGAAAVRLTHPKVCPTITVDIRPGAGTTSGVTALQRQSRRLGLFDAAVSITIPEHKLMLLIDSVQMAVSIDVNKALHGHGRTEEGLCDVWSLDHARVCPPVGPLVVGRVWLGVTALRADEDFKVAVIVDISDRRAVVGRWTCLGHRAGVRRKMCIPRTWNLYEAGSPRGGRARRGLGHGRVGAGLGGVHEIGLGQVRDVEPVLAILGDGPGVG